MHTKKEVGVVLKELKYLAIRKANYLFSKKIILENEAFDLMKLFFKSYFEIDHEISFIDITTYTKKSNLPVDTKDKVINFINQLSKILYSGADFTQKELHIMINDFKSLVEILIEDKKQQNILDKSVKKVIKTPFIKKLFIRKKNLKKVGIEPEEQKEKTKTYLSVREKLMDQMKHIAEEENTVETDITTAHPNKSFDLNKIQVPQQSSDTSLPKEEKSIDLNELLLKDSKQELNNLDEIFNEKSKVIPKENTKMNKPIIKKIEETHSTEKDKDLNWTSDTLGYSNSEELDSPDFLEEPKKYHKVKFDMFSKENNSDLTPKINTIQDNKDKDEMLDKIRKIDNNIEYLSKSVNDSPIKQKELLKKIMKIELMEDRLSNILDKNKKKVYHEEIDKHLDKHITEENIAFRMGEHIQRMKAKKRELADKIDKFDNTEKNNFIHPHTDVHIQSENHPDEQISFFSKYKENVDSKVDHESESLDNTTIKNKILNDEKYEDILNKAKEYIASNNKK